MADFTGPQRPEDVLGAFFHPALKLAALRDERQSELEDRLSNNPHDQAAKIMLSFLGRDQAEDPYTGKTAQDQEANTENALHSAALTQRPELVDAAKTKNMLAGDLSQQQAYGKGMGEATAGASQPAQYVADQASKRKIGEAIAPVAAGPMGEHVTVGSTGLPSLEMQAGGAASAPSEGGDLVNYWAQQVARDPSMMTQIQGNKGLANAVRMHLATSGGDLNKITNQTRQMGETAADLLPLIDSVLPRAQELHQQGLFTPGIGLVRRFLAEHGAGSLLGMGADTAQKVGRFNTDMGLLQSGIARAHAGARGAGNSAIADRFEKLMNSTGDLPTFLGELQGVRDLLVPYSKHAGAGAYVDPRADPNYQPQ